MNKTKEINQMCIILDTNIWVYKTYLLRSILGAAFLYVVYKNDALIGLPEVVELEIKKHAPKIGVEATKKIKENYSIIEKLIGKREEYNLPSLADFEQAVDDRLDELENKIFKIPFKFTHAKGALTRIMEETAPNSHKNQQFKDSAIWESVVEVSRKYNVFFITQDKGFFEDRNHEKGLASNLVEELKRFEGNVKVYYDIDNFLEDIKQEVPPLNEHIIIKLLDNLLKSKLKGELKNIIKDFKVNDINNYTISPYLTETTTELALNFNIIYNLMLIDAANDNEWEGTLSIKGECLLDIEQHYKLSNLQFDLLALNTPENCPISNLRVIYSGPIYIGRREIKYKLKEPLNL